MSERLRSGGTAVSRWVSVTAILVLVVGLVYVFLSMDGLRAFFSKEQAYEEVGADDSWDSLTPAQKESLALLEYTW